VLFRSGLAFSQFQLWVGRLALATDAPWPRLARIEVLGVVARATQPGADQADSRVIPFAKNGLLKVAKGSSLTLVVAADNSADVVPRYCSFNYETADGTSRSVRMTRVGSAESEDQVRYEYDDKPLIGMTTGLRFDVIGYDNRLPGYQIEVVDRPLITSSIVAADLPKYTGLLRREETVSGATQFPVGSSVALTMQSNKPIVSAQIFDLTTQQEIELHLDPPGNTLHHDFGTLEQDLALEVSLLDSDGIRNKVPHRLKIVAVPDVAPSTEMFAVGIGDKITQNALIRLAGRIEDDFAVDRAWIELGVIGGGRMELPVTPEPDGTFLAVVDLKEQQTPDGVLRVQPEDRLAITLFARDKCDLNGAGNLGKSEMKPLEVVTEEQLLSLLEKLESDLRARFEQIRNETARLRDEYARIQIEAKRFSLGIENFASDSTPPDGDENSTSAEDSYRKALDLQRLRIQRAFQASRKADGELVGVRTGFEDIRAELSSNRLDTTARKERLESMIIEPIGRLSDPMHAQLQGTTQELEALHDQPEPFMPVVESAILQTDAILLEMDSILEKMFDLENFNELMEKMRQLLEAQGKLREETEKLRKQQILDLLK